MILGRTFPDLADLGAEAGTSPPDPDDPLAATAVEVDRLLARFVRDQQRAMTELDPALAPVGDELAALVGAGGKRLRPAFVYWGYRATGGEHVAGLWHLAAAVELLHAFALVHDDVMDRGGRRRGRPTVHRALADVHTREGLAGDPDWFGVGAAVLAGDLLFVWADALVDAAPLASEAVDRARRVFTDLRVEVMAGQYLDLRLAGLTDARQDDALRVALLKSGRYTVSRPLQLGAAVGAADATLHEALRVYGDAVGVAFQLRDDVLGLFGDPDDTGKSAAEDLREGKRTLLVVRALELADPAGRGVVEAALGDTTLDEAGTDRVREVVADSGALAAVEELLEDRRQQAYAALGPVTGPARTALERLIELAVRRSR